MTVYFPFIINSVLLLILLIISGYWSCYFIKRIYSCIKYKRRAVRFISGYVNEQIHYNYETEIWKYTLLLLIIACEIIICLLFIASDIYSRFLTFHKVNNATVELPYSGCISYNKPALSQVSKFYEIPYLYGITTVARSTEICLLAFTIYLMEYLITRIKNIKLVNSRRFLLLTALLCAFVIFSAFIEFASILSITFTLSFFILYFCIFIRTSKQFKSALLQRVMERLFQHRPNKQAMKQYRYSKVSINILSCGYLLIIISEILISTAATLVSILFFGNCYFPSNLFPSLRYVLQTEEERDISRSCKIYILARKRYLLYRYIHYLVANGAHHYLLLDQTYTILFPSQQ